MKVTIDYDRIVNTVGIMEAEGYAPTSILKAVKKISPKTARGKTWTMARLRSAIENHSKRQRSQKPVVKPETTMKLTPETHKEVVEIIRTQDWEHNVSVVMSLPLSSTVKKDIISLLCIGEKEK